MPLTTGTRLGPYEILAPIGAGGMGEVYRARDTRLDRTVAIKVLPAHVAADPDFRERFEREAKVISSLDHPHICALYDIGEAPNPESRVPNPETIQFLVMQYLEGETLADRLKGGALSIEQSLEYAIQIADAVDKAHGQGITHRDLKPSNIFLHRSRGPTPTPLRSAADAPHAGRGRAHEGAVAKLLDFGLAKRAVAPGNALRAVSALPTLEPELTLQGTILGTVPYMPPEQAEGRPVDARGDVFSFGAILYEMVSGSRAFRGNSTAEVLSAVLRDDPAPLQAPPALERIVRRCLAKQPQHRFQTMAAVRAELEQASGRSTGVEPSIAVLPFANLSADKENEYFSDGLAEEIINVLAHIPGLKVTARTSAFAFRGKEQDIREIAQRLGVRTILEGSVRRAGSRIRVTAQLINAEDGYHLWSERYDREMADVFAIQDEMAQAIASALQMKLSMEPAALRRYTPSLPAYEAYLKALHYLGDVTPEKLARGREWSEQAVALDPGFALAHSSLGLYFLRLALGGLSPAHDAMPLARAAARKALNIDPLLPEAHSLLGVVAAIYDYDWKEAARLFQLATTGDRIPPAVRFFHGTFYLMPTGRLRDAVEENQRALKDDPLNLIGRFQSAMSLQAAGMDVQATAEFGRVLELDENFWLAVWGLGLSYALRGVLPKAIAFAEKTYFLVPWSANAIGLLAGVHALSGDRSRAEELLQKLADGPAYGAPVGFVLFHLLCSETDRAADWIEKAIEQRDPRIAPLLGVFGKVLRSSSRWPALARRINLSEAVT